MSSACVVPPSPPSITDLFWSIGQRVHGPLTNAHVNQAVQTPYNYSSRGLGIGIPSLPPVYMGTALEYDSYAVYVRSQSPAVSR